MTSAGWFSRWASWRWRFPIEIALAFLVGLMLTMTVVRSLRESPGPVRGFVWDDYIAAVAALYAINHDMDGARRWLGFVPSDNVALAVNAAANNPPGTGAYADWNRRNLEEFRQSLAASGPVPVARATPSAPAPPPSDSGGPDLLNMLAAFGVLVTLAGITVGGSRLLARAQQGGSTRERPRRRAAREAPELRADEMPDLDESPVRWPRSRRETSPPPQPPVRRERAATRSEPPVRVERPAPRRPEPTRPVPAPSPAAAITLRCTYAFGDDNFEELLPITDRMTGHLLGGCGVSSGLALPDAGETEAYVAFSVWIHDNSSRNGVRSVAVVSRWVWTERRDEVEEWASKMGLERVEVARTGVIQQFETERLRVDVVLNEVEYGHAAGLPRQSYFEAFGVTFNVTVLDALG